MTTSAEKIPLNGKLEKFKRIINGSFPDGNPKILIAQMDPDAIGSASMLAYALELAFQVAPTIYYAGVIDHPQTFEIFNHFRLKERFLVIPKDTTDLGNVILVDSSLRNDIRMGEKKFTPVVIIDHHDATDIKESENVFLWVEPVGATVTLVYRLLKTLEIKTEDDPRWQDLATQGALGIATDTKDFTEGVPRSCDVEAWSELMRSASVQHYSELMKYSLPARYFSLWHEITDPKNCTIHKTLLIAHTSPMWSGELAFLSRFADEYIRHEQASTVIVWSLVVGIGLAMKVRTMDKSEDITDLVRQFASGGGGKSTYGVGSGGTLVIFPTPIVPTEDNAQLLIAAVEKSLIPFIETIVENKK